MTQKRLSPDDRTPQEDTTLSTAPTIADVKPVDTSRWEKAGSTWVKEAEANVGRAWQYYFNASEYYRKAGKNDLADQAELISQQLRAIPGVT